MSDEYTFAEHYRTERRPTAIPRTLLRASQLMLQADRGRFLGILALQLIGGVMAALQIFVIAQTLGSIDDLDGSVRPVLGWIIAFVGVVAFMGLLEVVRVEVGRLLDASVQRLAEDRLLSHASAADLVDFDNPTFHNRLERAIGGAGHRPSQAVRGTLGTAVALLTIAGLVIAVATIAPEVLGLALLGAVPLWWQSSRSARRHFSFDLDETERDRRRRYLFTVLTDRGHAGEVRSLGLSSEFRDAHSSLWGDRIRGLRPVVAGRVRDGLIGALLSAIALGSGLLFLMWSVSADRMTVVDAGTVGAALLILGQRLQLLVRSLASLLESSLYLRDFGDLLFEDAEAVSSSSPARFGAESAVCVDDVSFRYPTGERDAVQSVSFDVPNAGTVALVGENGSGKTTLAKLIAGLYSPSQGAIRVGDVEVDRTNWIEYRKQVAVVFQDFAKFQLTARENITLDLSAGDDATMSSEVQAAVDAAGAGDLIDSLRSGISTLLGPEYERGQDLSGGQWQRIALARAFFRRPELLILDEPTAAIDPNAEYELFERIRHIRNGRAMVLISHRLSSVRNADLILMMDRGRVVERGTHEALIELDGQYAAMFARQASGYIASAQTDPNDPDV